MENSDKKFWKLQEDEVLPAGCSGHERQQFSESMIKTESVCAPDDDAASNVTNPDFVKTEEKLNYINWYQVIKDETVIKKEDESETVIKKEDEDETVIKNEDESETVIKKEDEDEIVMKKEDEYEIVIEREDEDEIVIQKEDDCAPSNSELNPRLCEDFVKCSSNIPTEICEVKNRLSLSSPDPTRDTNKLLCVDENRAGVVEENIGQHTAHSIFTRPSKCVNSAAGFASDKTVGVDVTENQDKCELYWDLFSGTRHKVKTRENPYKCDTCNAEFAKKDRLIKHKRTHTGERPYKCDMCSAAFADPSSLIKHKRTHTGEKPYKCDICNTDFAHRSTLTRHKLKHTGEKPYKCDVCGAQFADRSYLRRHKLKHTREKPLQT